MTDITLNDLLTLTTDELAEIDDNISPEANDEYVQKKIMAPLKSLAIISVTPGFKYLGYDLGDPSYDDLQTLLSAAVDTTLIGTNISLIVKVQKQLSDSSMTISKNRPQTLIKGESSSSFYIKTAPRTLNNMHFKDIEVKLAPETTLSDCTIKNSILSSDGNIYLSNVDIQNSLISVNNLSILDINTIVNCRIIVDSTITFDPAYDDSKMYSCYLNKPQINETKNATSQFNIIIPNM